MAHFDIAIIGTGSGNSILDERYVDKRVAICEQGIFGGTCLNVGCIPTKMFVYAAEVAQSARESAQYGVDAHVDGVRWGDIVSRVFGRIDPLALGGDNYRRSSPNVEVFASHTRFGPTRSDGRYNLRTDEGDEFTAEQVVIAAGSRAVVPSAIAECGVPHHTSDTIMRIADVPDHLIIVGGGFVACEFAHIFSALGSHVTLMIRGSTLLRGHDDDIAMRFTDIASKKWEIHSHHEVADARRVGEGVEIRCKDGSRLRGDALLVATGRVPNGDLLDAEQAGVKVTAKRSGRRRRVPAHLCAWHFRSWRRVVGLPAQARCQPRGPCRQAQPAAGLGRHRRPDAVEPPLRAVGGVHRPADRQRRAHREPGAGKGIQHRR